MYQCRRLARFLSEWGQKKPRGARARPVAVPRRDDSFFVATPWGTGSWNLSSEKCVKRNTASQEKKTTFLEGGGAREQRRRSRDTRIESSHSTSPHRENRESCMSSEREAKSICIEALRGVAACTLSCSRPVAAPPPPPPAPRPSPPPAPRRGTPLSAPRIDR